MVKVLLYSGGWDSYCASKIFPEAHKLYINLKTPYSEVEMAHLPTDVKIVDLDMQQFVMSNGHHIPQRNAIMCMIATAYGMTFGEPEIEVIMAGVKEDGNMCDKNPTYFKELERFINLFYIDGSNQKEKFSVKVTGFFDYDKIELWEKAGKPDVRNIISCYSANGFCGECLDCKRRLLLLHYCYPNEYIDVDVDECKEKLKDAEWLISDKL